MWLTFVVVAGFLAIRVEKNAVLRSAGVSAAAVLAAGWARTAMAAMGMWEFLMWDHDNVVFEAALEQVVVALASFPLAAAVAGISWLLFRWRRSAVRDA